jgi:hypothetical protein
MRFFAVFGKRILGRIGQGFRGAPTFSFEHEPVGAVT